MLPDGALRLFPNLDPEALMADGGRSLLCERLLEDGDSTDLRWLVAEVGSAGLAAWLGSNGGRRLSARSRAFWSLVLERESGAAAPGAGQLWPL
jgi:hypothetical protein